MLVVLLLLSVIGYSLMALWFPLVANIGNTPPGDIRTFAPTLFGGLAYATLIIILFGLFLLAVRTAADRGLGARPLPVILASTLLLAIPLLLSYPINATDIFGYVIRGRIASVYGESPFSAPAAAFVGDPFMPLVGEWAGETTPYGPMWEIVAAGLTTISGDNLLAGVQLFKALALASFMGVTTLIWQLLPAGPWRIAGTLLWAWNPGLLLTFVLNGHNDAFMIMWLVLGYWLGRRGWPAVGFLTMVLAVVTKPVAVLALPFFFLGTLQSLPDPRSRVRFVAITAVGSLAVAGLAFWPWLGQDGPLRAAVDLALRLVREATGGAGFSPAVWVYMVLGGRVSIEPIGFAGRVLFAAFSLWLVWRAWRGRSPLRGAADIFFGYLAGALNFRIWYATWPFPWLLLDAGMETGTAATVRQAEYRLRAGLWFLLTSQLSVIIYGHIRQFVLGGDQVLAHLIGVPFVFVLPWLLARLPVRLSRPVHVA